MHVYDINVKPYHLPKHSGLLKMMFLSITQMLLSNQIVPQAPDSSFLCWFWDGKYWSTPYWTPHYHYHETSLPVKEIAISMIPQLGLLLLLFLEAASIQCWPRKPWTKTIIAPSCGCMRGSLFLQGWPGVMSMLFIQFPNYFMFAKTQQYVGPSPQSRLLSATTRTGIDDSNGAPSIELNSDALHGPQSHTESRFRDYSYFCDVRVMMVRRPLRALSMVVA